MATMFPANPINMIINMMMIHMVNHTPFAQNFPFDSTLPPGLSQNNFPFETEADFMDWLEFVSATVQSLAWPATLMMCVLLLKEPLSERMKELIKLKYKDFELEFDKRLQKLVSVREKGYRD